MTQIFPFDQLPTCDLVVDAIYEGGAAGHAGDDPIQRLLPGAGNSGGFRGPGTGPKRRFVVLYSSGEDGDWPDELDPNTGQFVYFGDNKRPGRLLHDPLCKGNSILKYAFENAHGNSDGRALVCPFLVFIKRPTENSSRSVQFKGLAVPGFPGHSMTEDLVAIWKSTSGQRFQNYRSVFTILDAAVVERRWLNTLSSSVASLETAPVAWRKWVTSGKFDALTAKPTKVIRSLEEQTPDTPLKVEILACVYEHFKEDPFAFEAFAARVFQMTDLRVVIDEVTRASVDHGRDAIGRYLLGMAQDPIYAEFALEAKCYKPPLRGSKANQVGVEATSRLISRIRHRQFGVLVTTSVLHHQAYQEVRDDGHPIIVICGRDLAEILIEAGFNTKDRVRELITK
jgi:hypothetical protein